MKKTLSLSVGIILALVLSNNVQAAFSCSTTVQKVLVYAGGNVNILHSGRNDYTVICNLKGVRQNVSITTCAMWTSMLQNIKKNNGTAQFYYAGDGTCATLPTYAAAPAPVYIGDM